MVNRGALLQTEYRTESDKITSDTLSKDGTLRLSVQVQLPARNDSDTLPLFTDALSGIRLTGQTPRKRSHQRDFRLSDTFSPTNEECEGHSSAELTVLTPVMHRLRVIPWDTHHRDRGWARSRRLSARAPLSEV